MALKRREAKADLIGRDLERHNSQDWVNDLDGVARQNIVGFVEFRDLGVRIGTFNYEPYLPYLLKKAYTVRCEATGSQSDPKVIDALTSGFLYRDVESLEEGRGICLLQVGAGRSGSQWFDHHDLWKPRCRRGSPAGWRHRVPRQAHRYEGP